MRLAVVGLGLIGGSLALDLKARGFASEVLGVEASEAHSKQALELGLADRIVTLEEAVTSSDLVVLAVPVGKITEFLPRVLDLVRPDATVTDMGSTKEGICKSIAEHPRRKQYVASHPMAGTENSGPTAAHKGLYDRKTAVICDSDRSDPVHVARVQKMYEALGMRLVELSSTDHDLSTAFISHLSHISSFVLANTVLSEQRNSLTIFDLAGGGFESTVRLAKSSPDMWAPIFEHNHTNVVAALESYITHLQAFLGTLVDREFDRTRRLMKNANMIRPVLANIEARKDPKA